LFNGGRQELGNLGIHGRRILNAIKLEEIGCAYVD
jgi:hypothetical protein